MSLVQSVAMCIVNALIKALGESNKIPRIVVIIPHDDLASFLLKTGDMHNDEFDLVMHKVLNWMITSVN